MRARAPPLVLPRPHTPPHAAPARARARRAAMSTLACIRGASARERDERDVVVLVSRPPRRSRGRFCLPRPGSRRASTWTPRTTSSGRSLARSGRTSSSRASCSSCAARAGAGCTVPPLPGFGASTTRAFDLDSDASVTKLKNRVGVFSAIALTRARRRRQARVLLPPAPRQDAALHPRRRGPRSRRRRRPPGQPRRLLDASLVGRVVRGLLVVGGAPRPRSAQANPLRAEAHAPLPAPPPRARSGRVARRPPPRRVRRDVLARDAARLPAHEPGHVFHTAFDPEGALLAAHLRDNCGRPNSASRARRTSARRTTTTSPDAATATAPPRDRHPPKEGVPSVRSVRVVPRADGVPVPEHAEASRRLRRAREYSVSGVGEVTYSARSLASMRGAPYADCFVVETRVRDGAAGGRDGGGRLVSRRVEEVRQRDDHEARARGAKDQLKKSYAKMLDLAAERLAAHTPREREAIVRVGRAAFRRPRDRRRSTSGGRVSAARSTRTEPGSNRPVPRLAPRPG